MTKPHNRAADTSDHLPTGEAPVLLSPEERAAIVLSKAAAARGEFATNEEVRTVWAKHGL